MANRSWICVICGYVYHESLGDPIGGIEAGVAWDDVPDDWVCPDCGATKDSFEMQLIED